MPPCEIIPSPCSRSKINPAGSGACIQKTANLRSMVPGARNHIPPSGLSGPTASPSVHLRPDPSPNESRRPAFRPSWSRTPGNRISLRCSAYQFLSAWCDQAISSQERSPPVQYLSGVMSSRYLKHDQQTVRPTAFSRPQPKHNNDSRQ